MSDSAIVKRVQCLVCKKMLEYTDSNTGHLIDHLNSEHSNTQIFRYLGGDGVERINPQSTVIPWNPSDVLICHHCGAEAKPITQRRDYGKPLSRWIKGLFWCWPLCFPSRSRGGYVLHCNCANCNKYLGAFDSNSGKFTRVK